MKRVYERPAFLIETFVANQVVAESCKQNQPGTFKCFIGGSTDTEYVITDDNQCSVSASFYKGATSAENPLYRSGDKGGNTGGRVYTVENAYGLLCVCSSMGVSPVVKNADAWPDPDSKSSWEGVTVLHANATSDAIHRNNDYHCMVAPVGPNFAIS